MNVSAVVQHHPARAHLIPALLRSLGTTEVVEDPKPDDGSPLRTYLECLRRTPATATHRLIVQDDALLCENFPSRMLAALLERPHGLVAFFVPGAPPHRAAVLRAEIAGDTWVRLPPTWVPTVALCWPVPLIGPFLEWATAEYPEGDRRRGDDGPVGKWANRVREQVLAPIPSLVQHPDVVPSLIGRKASAGGNKARVAARYID